jgi:hypothetical protein
MSDFQEEADRPKN